jgi:hypothetical protein
VFRFLIPLTFHPLFNWRIASKWVWTAWPPKWPYFAWNLPNGSDVTWLHPTINTLVHEPYSINGYPFGASVRDSEVVPSRASSPCLLQNLIGHGPGHPLYWYSSSTYLGLHRHDHLLLLTHCVTVKPSTMWPDQVRQGSLQDNGREVRNSRQLFNYSADDQCFLQEIKSWRMIVVKLVI